MLGLPGLEVLSFGDAGYGDELLRGLLVTIVFAVLSYFFSLLLGFGLGLIANSKSVYLRVYWKVHASIIMGVPPLLIIFFIYFNLPPLLTNVLGRPVNVSPFVAGVVALSLNIGTYIGEVVRGAIQNVSKGQIEAAKSLGLPFRVRWVNVVLPQMFFLALPGLSNLWMVLLKETALVSLIGLQDIVRASKIAAGNTFKPFTFFITVGLVFVAFGYLTMRASRWLDSRVNAWAANR